ncbi:hypothetical protein [Halomonas sp. BN3-1]|uniref:hypothetical protein n=1 Tax=Halomonas sp. BN3-1 TaxID=2082393 RepID=UPI0013B41FE2|nr:hypothetical protein [Halomonas sp. BN3-1]
MGLYELDKSKLFEKIFRHQAKDKLERFREYTLEIECKFSADKNRLADSFSEATEGLNDDEIREVENYFSDDYYIIEEIHVGLYRRSTLVSVYSFLENSLNTLCGHLYKRHGYPVEVGDLHGEGIVRAKSYLEKLAGIDFSLLNGEWSTISSFNKIRNCIVHSEGNIKAARSTTQLKSIVTNSPGLSLKDERYIKIDREYIDAIITTVEKFMDKLYDQVFTQSA